MNLLIDIGNTSCKFCLSDRDGNLSNIERLAAPMDIMGQIPSGIETIVLSNVRERDIEYEHMLSLHCEKLVVLELDYVRKLVEERPDIPVLKVLDNMPDGMGADRMAAILAVHKMMPSEDVILFDFGTAITTEYIDGEKDGRGGHYVGGAISLGLNTRYRALNYFTKRIDLCDPYLFLDRKIDCIGYDLDTALAAGNILGIKFEIEGCMAANPSRKVVLTGGDAPFIASHLSKEVIIEENLVLNGLALLAQYNEK
ncbi:MAG: type III pantothenate kinase [Bacteroidales bacterium]|nr:type III pantothenate kinase [Bacteroidales bacterium]